MEADTYVAKWHRKKRTARKKKGMCLWCSERRAVNPKTGKKYVLCETHNAEHRAAQNKYQRDRRAKAKKK